MYLNIRKINSFLLSFCNCIRFIYSLRLYDFAILYSWGKFSFSHLSRAFLSLSSSRGIEGKIEAVRYVRENKIPFMGICLGMQMAVIEYARNVLKFENANSTEMNDNTPYPVITFMEEQKTITDKGGTMRLGGWDCEIKEGTKAYEIYGSTLINERHRHRYEFNNTYLDEFEKAV